MSNVSGRLFPLQEVSFTRTHIDEDGFWGKRLMVNRSVTIPMAIDQCVRTGRVENFAKAGHRADGPFEGTFFNDSDVYKVLEGVAYALMDRRDSELESRADAIIDQIAAAQEPNGYLMTYFTLAAPEKKWTDMSYHEMYCGGHLTEAATAYYLATGKSTLLTVARRLADHYLTTFGPGRRHWVPGHEEIELALFKLADVTKEARYAEFAKWLLDERGHGHGVGVIWDKPGWGAPYCQDDLPAGDLREARGHAVRAMYLYAAMTDAALQTGDATYSRALDQLWDNVVHRKMYITGGIGSSRHNEGFTEDYDLPNATAYCETCAAVGMVFWNHRMGLLHGDSRYADIVEQALYNGVLAGVSLDGSHFFYDNPLASDGKHHRQQWFGTSCCPTQIARFIPSIGNYVYATSADGIWVNQYMASASNIPWDGQTVGIDQQTCYPWDGEIAFRVNPETPSTFSLRLRIPGWSSQHTVRVNGQASSGVMEAGYAVIRRTWVPEDRVTLTLAMPIERVSGDARVAANRGRVALRRGPLVYCLEAVDNPDVADWRIDSDMPWVSERRSHLLGDVTVIRGVLTNGQSVVAVPYYAWDNREPGAMAVWIPSPSSDDPSSPH